MSSIKKIKVQTRAETETRKKEREPYDIYDIELLAKVDSKLDDSVDGYIEDEFSL